MILSLGLIVLHTLVLHYLFVWIERRIPPRPEVDISHLTTEERESRGKLFDRLTVVPMFLLWPVLAGGWFLAFQGLALWSINNHSGVEYAISSNIVFRAALDIFAGLFLAAAVGLLGLRLALGHAYYTWMACRDSVFPIDLRRFLYPLVVWVVPFFAEWDYHWATTYTVFTRDEVVIKEVWSLWEERDTYDRVASIEVVAQFVPNPDREFLPTAGTRIIFDDGRVWTNAQPGLWFTENDMGAIELTSEKSGKPIQVVPRL